MRVIVNRFLTLGPKTGIGHYTAELLRCLREQARPGEKIAGFPSGWLWRLGQRARPLVARGEKTPAQEQTPSLLGRVRQRALLSVRKLVHAYLNHSLTRRLGQHAFDLYHEPNTIPLSCDVPTLATIHDLSVLLHPEWHPAGRVAYFEKHLVPALERCVHLVAVSEFTRQETIRALHVPPEKITRVYNGIRPDLRPWPVAVTAAQLRRVGLPASYLLYVGTIEPRKNVRLLLEAYAAVPAPLRERCPLVLAGGWGWSSTGIAEYFETEARRRGVIHLGYVSDELLPLLYNGARALVYPSLYEGFGLPPLEMMACGGAVLAATSAAVAETAGSRACLLDPADRDAWRHAMAQVIADDDWQRLLRIGTVELARPFTWDRCAAETLQVYRSLCAGAGARRAQAA